MYMAAKFSEDLGLRDGRSWARMCVQAIFLGGPWLVNY